MTGTTAVYQPVINPFFMVSNALVLRDCNEGFLVFDEMNGKTSLLNLQAGRVLRALITNRDLSESDLRTLVGMGADNDEPKFQDLMSSLFDSGLVGS